MEAVSAFTGFARTVLTIKVDDLKRQKPQTSLADAEKGNQTNWKHRNREECEECTASLNSGESIVKEFAT